jgi:hypothetical protein
MKTNLAVSKPSEVPEIRNCLRIVGQAHNFFSYPKRRDVLSKALAEAENIPKIKTLKKCVLHDGRWIERFDSVSDFKEIYVYVVDALSEVSEWKDRVTANEARSLVNGITQGKFIIALFVTAKLFALGHRQICKHLQKISIDLKEAVSLAEGTISEMQKLRNNAEDEFKEIFKQATLLANEVSGFIVIPRLTAHQRHRSNPGNQNTPEDLVFTLLFKAFFVSE